MTRKKSWGAHARCCAIAIFQLTELNIKANPPCFARARAHVCVLMTQKSCAVEMRNAILRNYLKITQVRYMKSWEFYDCIKYEDFGD